MDEPPEVKHFLQELGEGGRAAPEPGLPEDGLPASGARLPCLWHAPQSLSHLSPEKHEVIIAGQSSCM